MRRQQASRLADEKDRDHPFKQASKVAALVKPSVEPRGDPSGKNRRSKEARVAEGSRAVRSQKQTEIATARSRLPVHATRTEKRSSREIETARSVYAKKPLGNCNADRLAVPDLVHDPKSEQRAAAAETTIPLCPVIGQFKVEFGADMWDTSDESEPEEEDDLKFLELNDEIAF
jgi:hypothetical protein